MFQNRYFKMNFSKSVDILLKVSSRLSTKGCVNVGNSRKRQLSIALASQKIIRFICTLNKLISHWILRSLAIQVIIKCFRIFFKNPIKTHAPQPGGYNLILQIRNHHPSHYHYHYHCNQKIWSCKYDHQFPNYMPREQGYHDNCFQNKTIKTIFARLMFLMI